MESKGLGKYSLSFGLSLAVTSVLSALLVVIKELNEGTVLAWMKQATGHHWVTHGVFNLVAFVVLGFLFAAMSRSPATKEPFGNLTGVVVGTVLASASIIAGFFLVVS
ncbi:hypothetical protein [Syntrophobacter fumaroxidans]|uniref:Conserved hypothetical membrane protein n=1 Tax=Syntrophobacter fumaroxidans (strain DSM 10017 / MPOB) TaxID=335543 RepID=A0LHN3_SYNFM|nr:hypothetical protein [Syntrophobacter fumaroxidans]ABK16935.1 conserved hypothetical membrane protein [Syntrophobacter fumaroxidans MPOB]